MLSPPLPLPLPPPPSQERLSVGSSPAKKGEALGVAWLGGGGGGGEEAGVAGSSGEEAYASENKGYWYVRRPCTRYVCVFAVRDTPQELEELLLRARVKF